MAYIEKKVMALTMKMVRIASSTRFTTYFAIMKSLLNFLLHPPRLASRREASVRTIKSTCSICTQLYTHDGQKAAKRYAASILQSQRAVYPFSNAHHRHETCKT